jgi:hypothetical protein
MGADPRGQVVIRLRQPFAFGVELDAVGVIVGRLVVAGLCQRGPDDLFIEAFVHEQQHPERVIDRAGADLVDEVEHFHERARRGTYGGVLFACDLDESQAQRGAVLLCGFDVGNRDIELQFGQRVTTLAERCLPGP